MKRITDKALRDALAAQPAPAAMRSREDFWADFKARARLRPQEQAEVAGLRPWLPAWPVYARAAAGLALVAVMAWLAVPRGPRQQGVLQTIEVIAQHSAVLIIEDAQTDSTVLWITGMEADTRNGGRI